MLSFLSKIYPVCHTIANGIEPGSDSKTTDILIPATKLPNL